MAYKSNGTKIHRRGPSVFHKSHMRSLLKYAGYVVMAAVVITAGFFMTKLIHEGDFGKTSVKSSSTSKTGSQAQQSGAAQSATQTTKAVAANSSGSLRTFYITTAQLGNLTSLDTLLDSASKAGFNAVLFDLKSEDGKLHYQSATDMAVKAQATASDAMTMDSLKSVLQHLKAKNFTAIPRLCAFKDPVSPFNLPSAKITVTGDPGCTWLDNYLNKGGKPWLNPYSADAHQYIIGLAKELTDAGFQTIMLDDVQFPNQTSQADYGKSDLSSLSHSEVLAKFVADLSSAVGSGCRVLQSMPGLSAFGDGTEPFGGNPVTFGAKIVSPVLMPSTLGSKLTAGEDTLTDLSSKPYDTVKLAAGQVSLRLELIDKDKRPTMMPWLQGYDYSGAQIKQQIQAVTETLGSDASYILYNSDGSYDFSSLV